MRKKNIDFFDITRRKVLCLTPPCTMDFYITFHPPRLLVIFVFRREIGTRTSNRIAEEGYQFFEGPLSFNVP